MYMKFGSVLRTIFLFIYTLLRAEIIFKKSNYANLINKVNVTKYDKPPPDVTIFSKQLASCFNIVGLSCVFCDQPCNVCFLDRNYMKTRFYIFIKICVVRF